MLGYVDVGDFDFLRCDEPRTPTGSGWWQLIFYIFEQYEPLPIRWRERIQQVGFFSWSFHAVCTGL